MLVCVFCENVWDSDTFVCPECGEYKGLMPIKQGSEYLGIPLEELEANA